MKELKYCLLLFLVTFTFSSCVRNEIEETPWNTEDVPMVYSVISPGHPAELYLWKGYFEITAKKPIPYPEAKVFICVQDSAWVELNMQAADTAKFTDTDNLLKVVKGETYYLRIELKNKTLHAQTTVPTDGATIIDASCIIPFDDSNPTYSYYVEINGKSISAKQGLLTVKLNLPLNPDYGCYLSAFSREVGTFPSLKTELYQQQDFLCPVDNHFYYINLLTIDSNLKKFRVAQNINFGQDSGVDFITSITSAFGGVIPVYTNIENGVGLFASFSTNSKLITVTQLTK